MNDHARGAAGGSRSLSFVATAMLAGSVPATAVAAEAPNTAAGWDHLWTEVMVDITLMGIVFAALTIYFMFKYRRKDAAEEGSPPTLSAASAVGWALIPAFIFMADDFFLAAKGWQLWNEYRTVPESRLEVKLESGMYSWDYTYPNGVTTQNELIVPAGTPIMLRMTSRDTIHSHFIPDFRIKEDSMPGRITYIWFKPQEPGEHLVTCAEYCGIFHSYMYGKVIVKSQADFDAWYRDAEAALTVNGNDEPRPEALPTLALGGDVR